VPNPPRPIALVEGLNLYHGLHLASGHKPLWLDVPTLPEAPFVAVVGAIGLADLLDPGLDGSDGGSEGQRQGRMPSFRAILGR